MTTLIDIQTALANDARRNELRLKIANLNGQIKATAVASDKLSSINSDALVSLNSAQSELTALELGAGPGVTDDFGVKSNITQLLENERAAAKSAVIDYVKANPTCTAEACVPIWDAAAVASHPTIVEVFQPALPLSRLFQLNLYAHGEITSPTWENQRAWILSHTKQQILDY